MTEQHIKPTPITHEPWHHLTGVRHGFFTRHGGVSEGIYAGLNAGLGSSDEPDRVHENRRRIAETMKIKPEGLTTVHQVHSPDVVTVNTPISLDARPKADAMVTNRKGLALSILTADCGPILFADAEAGVIGAAHAGWKGALGGIVENTVAAMEALGAQRNNIEAVLGPTISRNNYEVGPDFSARLIDLSQANKAYLSPSERAAHFMFDLPAYILAQAAAAGITCTWTGQCTYADERNFYSYRRTTHRGETDYGRGLSAIVLED